MPKAPVKKSVKAKVKSKAKAVAKAKSPVAKRALVAKKKVNPLESERGFMWKILKQKQEQRKRLEMNGRQSHPAPSEERPVTNPGLNRFASPRRRAG